MQPNVFETANAGFAQALYEDYLRDPASVSPEWRRLFESGQVGERPVSNGNGAGASSSVTNGAPASAQAGADGASAPAGATLIKGPALRLAHARRWREALMGVFNMLLCAESTVGCLMEAMKATDDALKSSTGNLACNAWETRFKAEIKKRGCSVKCDSARLEWLAKKYKMPASDPVAVAIKHKRQGLAPATSSPHGVGRALDLYLGGPASTAAANVQAQRATAAYRWMAKNAAKFGFYPYNVEPWHWEYNPPA